MNTTLYGIAFTLAWFVFAVPTAIFLLRSYGRTKMNGFIWLLMALVVWPFIAQGFRIMLPAITAGMGYGMTQVLVMNLGLTTVGGVLLLIAVVILDKELGQRIVAAEPVVSAVAVAPTMPIAPPPPTDLR